MLTDKSLFQCAPNKFIIKSSGWQKKKLKIKEGHELCNMAKTNPKLFWKSVKKKLSTNKIQSDNLTTNGLFEHFKSFYGEEPAEINQHTPNNNPDNTFNTDLDMEISETGLKTAIFSQKMIKALAPIVYVLNYSKIYLI